MKFEELVFVLLGIGKLLGDVVRVSCRLQQVVEHVVSKFREESVNPLLLCPPGDCVPIVLGLSGKRRVVHDFQVLLVRRWVLRQCVGGEILQALKHTAFVANANRHDVRNKDFCF